MINYISPENGSRQVVIDTSLEFQISDNGDGIDISTLNVLINDEFAIYHGDIQLRFSGPDSDINPVDDNYYIIIDPDFSFSKEKRINIKIHYKDLLGKNYNFTSWFETESGKPFLYFSNPSNNQILERPQLLYFEFRDSEQDIDPLSLFLSINDLEYIIDGEINTDYATPNSSITLTNDGKLIVRLELYKHFVNGNFNAAYRLADTNMSVLSGKVKFTIALKALILPEIFPQTGFLGFYQGIKRVYDIGDGHTLLIEWNKPLQRFSTTDLYLLIYQNVNRLNIFDSQPKYIAKNTVDNFNLENLRTGKTYSYAVRSFETYSGIFNFSNLSSVGTDVYSIPDPVELTSIFSTTDTSCLVTNTDGYPSSGLLLINKEVVKYTSKTDTTFNIPLSGRGLNSTLISTHLPEDSISLFLNCTDDNTVIVMGTPTYRDGYESGREAEGEGFLVTDYTDNDKNFFEGFDYCGYHQFRPELLLGGVDDCGTYAGGEFNGHRGLNAYDRLLNREEMLLQVTGEPVILLKRNWSGKTCSCSNSRTVHPKINSCPTCYGTTWDPGYKQFLNLRRDDRMLLVKFNEAPEDLSIGAQSNFQQEFEPQAWTMPIPAIRDRDILVRFDPTGDIEYIYEVLDVSREKIFLNKYGKQTMRLKRLDKTDIIYSFPYIIY